MQLAGAEELLVFVKTRASFFHHAQLVPLPGGRHSHLGRTAALYLAQRDSRLTPGRYRSTHWLLAIALFYKHLRHANRGFQTIRNPSSLIQLISWTAQLAFSTTGNASSVIGNASSVAGNASPVTGTLPP
jgi:hypothetical protein